MKLTKEDRDEFVLNNYNNMTNVQLAEGTGWGMTTIKSVKRRLGLAKKSQKVLDMEAYALEHYPTKDDKEIAEVFGMKHDNVRDALKSLGIYQSQGYAAYLRIVEEYKDSFEFFDDYITCKDRIKLRCVVCGKEHYQRPNDLVTKGFYCSHIPEGNSRLYVMKSDDMYKIGYSNNPLNRLLAIKDSSNLERLELLHSFEGDCDYIRATEKYLHMRYRHKNCELGGIFDGSTEFFYLSPQDLEEILRLCSFDENLTVACEEG